MRWLLVLLLSFASAPAWAGFIELGSSVNYRSSRYDSDNYIESLSFTGTFSYYFLEMCAWELNYTSGYSKQVTKGEGVGEVQTTVEDRIEMISMDLVLSFASRQDPFRPYIKLGAGYLTKQRFRKHGDDPRDAFKPQRGIVPSAGVGLAISLTKELSLKFGVDAWTSPMDVEPVVVDYAGRAGISWLF